MVRGEPAARAVVLGATLALMCAVTACDGPQGSAQDELNEPLELPNNLPVLSGSSLATSVETEPTLCGDGVVGAGEYCDLAIPESVWGGCPTRCKEVDGCAIEALIGDGCGLHCAFNEELVCVDGDGCCVSGCDGNLDSDCPSICGNGIIEPGENCEPTGPDDALCSQECLRLRAVFKVTSTTLADPHLWIGMGSGGMAGGFCQDMATMGGEGGMMGGMMGGGDGGGDEGGGMMGGGMMGGGMMGGMMGGGGDEEDEGGEEGEAEEPAKPHSSVLAIEPWIDGPQNDSVLAYVEGTCSEGIPEDEIPQCYVYPDADPTMAFDTMHLTVILNESHGDCLEIIEGTTSGYEPPPMAPVAPCFVSDESTVSMDMGGMVITLEHARTAGTWVGDPVTGLENILLRGFLTEESAESNLLPEEYSMVGGKPMSSLFAGGKDNCSPHDDRDVGPDGETVGWWLYLNLDAVLVQELMSFDRVVHAEE